MDTPQSPPSPSSDSQLTPTQSPSGIGSTMKMLIAFIGAIVFIGGGAWYYIMKTAEESPDVESLTDRPVNVVENEGDMMEPVATDEADMAEYDAEPTISNDTSLPVIDAELDAITIPSAESDIQVLDEEVSGL